jgi:hypothetical protein
VPIESSAFDERCWLVGLGWLLFAPELVKLRDQRLIQAQHPRQVSGSGSEGRPPAA